MRWLLSAVEVWLLSIAEVFCETAEYQYFTKTTNFTNFKINQINYLRKLSI